MSRVPYYLLVAAFGLMTLGGLALAAPTPEELGWIEHEMTCAEWLEAPEPVTGSARLTDCALAPAAPPGEGPERGTHATSRGAAALGLADLATNQAPSSGGATEAATRLWSTEPDPGTDASLRRALVLVTHDPELRRLADTFTDRGDWWPANDVGVATSGSRHRFRERHADELRRARTVEGVIEEMWRSSHASLARPLGSDGPSYVIAPAGRVRASRAPGLVLATFGGLALLLLVLAQRRWTRRREELTGAADRPLTF